MHCAAKDMRTVPVLGWGPGYGRVGCGTLSVVQDLRLLRVVAG